MSGPWNIGGSHSFSEGKSGGEQKDPIGQLSALLGLGLMQESVAGRRALGNQFTKFIKSGETPTSFMPILQGIEERSRFAAGQSNDQLMRQLASQGITGTEAARIAAESNLKGNLSVSDTLNNAMMQIFQMAPAFLQNVTSQGLNAIQAAIGSNVSGTAWSKGTGQNISGGYGKGAGQNNVQPPTGGSGAVTGTVGNSSPNNLTLIQGKDWWNSGSGSEPQFDLSSSFFSK